MDELFIDGHKLPKPLSKKEVYELLDRMSQGDDSAREKLVEHNIRLVLYEVTGKFKSVDYDKKDLVSIGNVGLMKAIATFDITKKVEFATYATRCIDNEILMFLRKLKKDQNVDSLNRTINHDKDGSELKIEDTISDDTDIVEEYTDNETHQIIRQIVKELPERDREIIMLHFGFYNDRTYTQKEIADKMSISQSYVSRLITKIVKRVAYQLEQRGVIELRDKDKPRKKKEAIKSGRKEGGVKMAKELQTIYQYFSNYTKEEVDVMLGKLTEEERALITLRYGEDLNNPQPSEKWDKKSMDKFYGSLIPKMKRLLTNPNNEKKPRGRKPKSKETSLRPKRENTPVEPQTVPTTLVEDVELLKCPQISEEQREPGILFSDNDEMTKEDYLKMLELLRTPSFTKMMTAYSQKEIMIASLKLGYIDGKCFSTTAISEFLGIDSQEVIDTTRTILLAYKERINQIIDGAIKITVDEPTILSEMPRRSVHK